MVAPNPHDFVEEASELVEAMGRALLALDAAGDDPSVVNDLFRAAHSLKGVSAMFGVDAVTGVAHAVEDVLEAIRLGRVVARPEVIDGLHEAVDVLTLAIAAALDEVKSPALDAKRTEVIARLAAVTRADAGGQKGRDVLAELDLGHARATLTEYEEHRLRTNVLAGRAVWRVTLAFSLDDFDVRLSQLVTELKPDAEVVSTLPSTQPQPAGRIGFELLVASGLARGALAPRLPPDAVVTPIESTVVPLPAARAAVALEAPVASIATTVRVDIGRLDELMSLVGELLLVRSNLQRLSDAANVSGATPMPRAWARSLQRETRMLERKLDLLQKGVLDARMVPLGQVFDRLSRLMRRLVRESGKQVEFKVSGADVELDKLIIDELSDPLMHLLRNALDHGLETPAARRQAGKSETGAIRLTARARGSHVIIEVEDDGAGLDEARIRQVAAARGLLPRRQLDELSRVDALRLVFTPGFSTRTEVSVLSGRGVGLDVVKTNLARLSGVIDLASEPGQGTTVSLTLPLTLAIVRALLIEVVGHRYALPANSVLEVVRMGPSSVRTLEGRPVIDLRGQTVTLLDLAGHFGHGARAHGRAFVVVVGVAQQRVGLVVDALHGQHDVVVKSLGPRLRDVPGLLGAAELGDGRAVMVLDVRSVVDEALRPRSGVG